LRRKAGARWAWLGGAVGVGAKQMRKLAADPHSERARHPVGY